VEIQVIPKKEQINRLKLEGKWTDEDLITKFVEISPDVSESHRSKVVETGIKLLQDACHE